jgi:hypothetical protein
MHASPVCVKSQRRRPYERPTAAHDARVQPIAEASGSDRRDFVLDLEGGTMLG